jgi:adenosylcobinamide-GDP ribazoletransferase
MRLFDDIRSAIGLMTLLPVGDSGRPSRPVAWFPWVGWLFGVAALAVVSFARYFIEGELAWLLVAVLVVTLWAVGSRLLHLDGLADTGDAIWGGYDPQRRLEIMRDSHTGAFGVAAVVFIVLLQIASIAVIASSGGWWALGAAPVLGRFAASVGVWSMPPARHDGLAASVSSSPRFRDVLIAALAVGMVLVVPCPARIALVVFGSVAAFATPRLLGRTVGGVTGDILGASVLLVETAVLVIAALMGV